MPRGATQLSPSGWKCYTLFGPPTKAVPPTGGWFLDDDEIGGPFLEQVQALGLRSWPATRASADSIPRASLAAASPAGHRPGRRRVPRHQLRRVPLGV